MDFPVITPSSLLIVYIVVLHYVYEPYTSSIALTGGSLDDQDINSDANKTFFVKTKARIYSDDH